MLLFSILQMNTSIYPNVRIVPYQLLSVNGCEYGGIISQRLRSLTSYSKVN